jgi:putative ABC transport system permease protein
MAIIKLERVSKYYQNHDTVSVGMKGISLEFQLGEFVVITGESGSGKSTLLNVISGLDKYEEGEILFQDEETSHFTTDDLESYRRDYIGFVFQNYNIIDAYTVYQNIILALELQNYPSQLRKERAYELIKKVDLWPQRHQKASKLSGGQKQRAVIARALAKDTPILVCDEPTGNLDQTSAIQIMKLLHDVSQNKLVVLVTHDYEQAATYATRRIKMSDGEMVEDKILKHVELVTTYDPIKRSKVSFKHVIQFAIRNIFSQPKRFLFVLFLMIVAISSFTIVYSNNIFNIRNTGLEQSRVFPNVPDSRLLIEKRDGMPLNEEDLNVIESISGVSKVDSYGALYLNEISFYAMTSNESYVEFAYTDAARNLLESQLVRGRLPELENEIVLGTITEQYLYNETIDLMMDGYGFDAMQSTLMKLEVVGIINQEDGNRIYFSDLYLNQMYPSIPSINLTLKNEVKTSLERNLQMLYQNDVLNVERYYDTFEGDLAFDYNLNGDIIRELVTFKTLSLEGEQLSITLYVDIIFQEQAFFIVLDASFYDALINNLLEEVSHEFNTLPSPIASVSIDNRVVGERLITELDDTLYKVYYPAIITTPLRDFFVFILTVVAIVFLTLFGLFLYAVIHAVTRNMMSSRMRDFSIYRAIGAHQKTLSLLVITEQIILSIIGLAISIVGLYIVTQTVVDHGLRIEYMTLFDYVILVSSITLFGAWLGVRFNQKVFHFSVIQSLAQSRGDLS